MHRAAEICESSSKILKEAQENLKCNDENTKFRPRRPSLLDFIQVASLCLPGLSCPSFQQEELGLLDDGFYNDIGYEKLSL